MVLALAVVCLLGALGVHDTHAAQWFQNYNFVVGIRFSKSGPLISA